MGPVAWRGRGYAGHARGAESGGERPPAPAVVLDILAHFTLFATDKKKRRIKIVCRYQQYEAVNLIVERVLAGKPRKGLIWHFQGSGKSLPHGVRRAEAPAQPELGNPTVIIVVDRIDLDAQISSTFHASDVPNLREGRDARGPSAAAEAGHAQGHHHDDLQVRRGRRRAERPRATSSPSSTKRTAPQEGDLGMKMRARCPTRSCSASPARPSTGATGTRSTPSGPRRTRAAT